MCRGPFHVCVQVVYLLLYKITHIAQVVDTLINADLQIYANR